MIDISDGLLADLRQIMKNSQIGATIYPERIPLSKAFKEVLSSEKKNDIQDLSLHGGEDYELLFTVPPFKLKGIVGWAKKNGIPITEIGKIHNRRGRLFLATGSQETEVGTWGGYRHRFSERE
jgi:thiamine-monophosphate kinase